MEPYVKPPQTTPPLQNLLEPWWNPVGTLVEPWWNPGGTLVEPLVEPWWNLSSGSPRTTPEPIWAETPKLSAVGGGKKKTRLHSHKWVVEWSKPETIPQNVTSHRAKQGLS